MKNKVVFLDRDGVINKDRSDYVKTPDEFEIILGVEKWLKMLVDAKFKLIVITNQSMIGRGLSTIENLEAIHKKMQYLFQRKGFQIDKIYYCIHRPEDNCRCRKPRTKLIQDAIREFSIDIKESWFIGDKDSDMIAAQSIGCNAIKIQTNSNIKDAVLKILGS